MEEIVQTLFEDGVLRRNGTLKLAKPMNEVKVPATVQAVLASRSDRLLAEEKEELLQTLAVLGREFSLGLVRRVWRWNLHPRGATLAEQQPSAAPLALSRNQAGEGQSELEGLLAPLQAGEFIYEQPATGDVEYVFKHALTQEVAYNSLLIDRRKLLHERAGVALESIFARQLEDHLDELAHHYSRSDNLAKAVEYLGRAGRRALQRSAYADAASSLTAALDLLQRLPESRDAFSENCASSWPLARH
jgi:predicted ATPase